jgi:DDE superfamily endonuclease
MLHLPARFAAIIVAFAPLFRHRTWRHAEILLVGAILAPGKRTVTSILRISGLSRERHFVNYHRVLSRARWSGCAAARLLLGLLVHTFVPTGPVILGVDDTIERRRGKRIKAKGIYRDPVRSSDAHFVKASGLRWLSLMLLAPIPWAARTWALPFLTALAPSERYCRERGQRHKTLTDWARQMVLQVRRWLPERELVLVADMGFAALELLAALSHQGVICITRLRPDAALYEPAPPRQPGTKGRPRIKGARLPNLSDVLIRTSTRWRRVTVPSWYGEGDRLIEFCSATAVWHHSGKPIVPIRWVLLRDPLGRFSPQALLCTDPTRDPLQIIGWFILRWQIEVTFQEARAHLGLETQELWRKLGDDGVRRAAYRGGCRACQNLFERAIRHEQYYQCFTPASARYD